MRRDRQRLDDILEALDSLARIIHGGDEAEFLRDEIVRYAVVQRLTVVGEAAAGVSSELRQRHAAIPWTDIVAFRNVASWQIGMYYYALFSSQAATISSPPESVGRTKIAQRVSAGNA